MYSVILQSVIIDIYSVKKNYKLFYYFLQEYLNQRFILTDFLKSLQKYKQLEEGQKLIKKTFSNKIYDPKVNFLKFQRTGS